MLSAFLLRGRQKRPNQPVTFETKGKQMQSLRYVASSVREFSRRWGSYLVLVGTVGAVVSFGLVPLLEWATTALLAGGGIPYLSYDNAWLVVTQHPGIAAALVMLLLAVLMLVFIQFAILLSGVENIRTRRDDRLRTVVVRAFGDLRHLRVGSFGFFILYLSVIAPISGTAIGSDLTAKAKIPVFIIDFITQQLWVVGVILVGYAVLTYLGVRWIQLLPNVVLRGQSLKEAGKNSWAMTHHRFWFYFWRLFWLGVVTNAATYGLSYGLVALQTWFDQQPGIALPAAVVTMTVLIIGQLILTGMGSVLFLLLLVAPDDVRANQGATKRSKRRSWVMRLGAVAIGGLTVLVIVGYNVAYMYGELDAHPLVISHRGVDGANGVQNTIPALEATAKNRPDYVEMDIHETADGQFVVMHDDNLKVLAGVDRGVHELTLAELTALTVRENGHQAKIASFDAYLAAAERLNQRLIVEIKTTKQDSPNMVARFIARYGDRLIRNGDRVHSLSFPIIEQVHRARPKLYVSFILPYTLVYPNTTLNAYTMEETTLDASFIDDASARHQAVWAWTINNPDDMAQMLFLNVDGIITDNMSVLQQTIAAHNDHPSYAQRLALFANTMDTFSGSGVEN